MPAPPQRSSARTLAPLALVACALAVLVVIAVSGGGGSSGDSGGTEAADDTSALTTTAAREPRQPATYTVEPGDTLGGIAEDTGVPVDTLLELNPELDPQALISGQRIKLRE
jgi:LysM repeat protein